MQFWQRQFETVGRHTFEVNLGGERVIVTEDPENIKAILATQFHDFGKGEVFHRDWHEFLGDSIFNTDGDLWHQSRQLFRPQFVRDRVSDLKTFERHVVTLLEKMAGDGSAVDVKDLFFRYTLDTISDFLLGESVGSLEDPQVRWSRDIVFFYIFWASVFRPKGKGGADPVGAHCSPPLQRPSARCRECRTSFR